MNPLMRAAGCCLLALLLVGCASAGESTWTYAPPASGAVSPAPAGEASGEPSASAGAAAGSPGAASPGASGPASSPGASGEAAATILEIETTQDDPLAFSESTLSAPAQTEVTVRYLNDSNVQHDIAFFAGPDPTAPRLAATKVGTGPDNLQEVTFTTPDPGSYFFRCDVHPGQMNGTLEVS
jgi:plastocyanin